MDDFIDPIHVFGSSLLGILDDLQTRVGAFVGGLGYGKGADGERDSNAYELLEFR